MAYHCYVLYQPQSDRFDAVRVCVGVLHCRWCAKRSHLFVDVLQLQHGNADQPIVTRETIVLDADVQLEIFQLLFVADFAAW